MIRIRQGTGYDSGTNGWGRLTGVSFGPLTIGNAPATESYSYTVAGDMSAKTLVNKWSLSASFTYDSEGKPVTTTYPGWGYSGTGLVQTNAYDAMSRLISVSNIEALGTVSGCTPTPPTSGTVTWAQGARYNSAGQLTDLERFGSGGNTCAGLAENYFNEHWNYNALNQLTEIDTSAQSLGFPVPSPNPGTANVFFSRYNFSATANNGQVASVDDARQSGANIVYAYDALKRLTNATTAAWTQTIGYDGFGNITSKTVPPTSAEPAFPGAVSAKNWLAGVSYDLNGNALAVNAFALTYDVENRLATATSGTAVESYLYDESNHRVEKTIGSSDYFYFYGPDGRLLTILQLWAGTTSLVADRVYFGGLLLGSAGPGVWNDVSTMTDRLGTAVTGYPYGTDIGSVSASNDQPDFATYTEDGTTGFEYANHRYYSAGLGRFLSVDPYGNSAQLDSPESWNRYTYASDDPVGSFDPFGLGNCTPDDLSGCGGNWSVTVSSGNGGQANFLADDTGNTTACPHGSLGKKDGGSSNCDGRNPTTPVARFTTSVPCQTIASQALSGSSLQKFSQAVESFASSLVNAITGFEQFQDGTQGAATMTWQWATGTGPDSQVFDPSSQQSADMAVSVLVGNAVSKYLSTGKFYGGESFGLNELVAAGINPTQQFVGSFSYSIGNRGDGNITLDLWNNTSFTSLTYGKGPSWTRSQFGPGGNMSQEYMITMPCK